MTDKEIIKALECCGEIDDGCLHCPLLEINVPECAMRLCKESLELHKSQQAEIERLRDSINAKCDDCAGCTQWNCDCANERAEAIKEFAEKLADVFYSHDKGDTYVREVVYNLVKEMAGDDK